MKLALINSLLAAMSLFVCAAGAQTTQPSTQPAQPGMGADPANSKLPTIWLIGDSTVRVNTKGQVGWGDPFIKLFDAGKVNVVNRAIGGRSSRTFHTEGRWVDILGKIKPGDLVLMQFGHNDGIAPDNKERPRGTLKGTGEETVDIIHPQTGKPETVHTYGWYMRKYVTEAEEKGATPIMVTLIPRCPEPYDDVKVEAPAKHPSDGYATWAAQVAEQEKIPCIDLNYLVSKSYAGMTRGEIYKSFFFSDHTHTSLGGAEHNAKIVYDALMDIAKGNEAVAKAAGKN